MANNEHPVEKVNETTELALVSRTFPVAKTNAVIQKARTKLSLFEQKMLAYAISKINPVTSGKPELHYTLEIRDICAVCGLYTDSGKVYALIRKAFKRLLTPTDDWVRLTDAEGVDSYVPFRWLEKVRFTPKKGLIDIMWDEEIAPFVFDLKRCYFSYPLQDILAMRSSYSLRLYELLSSYASMRSYSFELDTLRSLLYDSKTVHGYDRLADFRKRIIDPAVEEINTYTGMDVSYELVMSNRKCTHIRFSMGTKNPMEMLRAKITVDEALDGFSYDRLTFNSLQTLPAAPSE